MAHELAPNNDRADVVLVTEADGTQTEVPIPEELQSSKVVEISLSAETIEALGKAIGKALKR
jgi:hypothetical protein